MGHSLIYTATIYTIYRDTVTTSSRCLKDPDSPNRSRSATIWPSYLTRRGAPHCPGQRWSRGCGPTSRRRSSRTQTTSSSSSQTRKSSPSLERARCGPSAWSSTSRDISDEHRPGIWNSIISDYFTQNWGQDGIKTLCGDYFIQEFSRL